MRRLIGTVAALMAAWPALADDADVLSVEATAESAGTWRFAVTVSHPDNKKRRDHRGKHMQRLPGR